MAGCTAPHFVAFSIRPTLHVVLNSELQFHAVLSVVHTNKNVFKLGYCAFSAFFAPRVAD